jgi:hypothetical protein
MSSVHSSIDQRQSERMFSATRCIRHSALYIGEAPDAAADVAAAAAAADAAIAAAADASRSVDAGATWRTYWLLQQEQCFNTRTADAVIRETPMEFSWRI